MLSRLDEESEGLLILTNDGDLHHRLIDPKFAHPRCYLVQVERVPDEAALAKLRSRVTLDAKMTRPPGVKSLPTGRVLWPKRKPIRYRKTVPTSWIDITLTEGKNR